MTTMPISNPGFSAVDAPVKLPAGWWLLPAVVSGAGIWVWAAVALFA